MFGEFFKNLRNKKNLTLIELSEKTGVSKSYLHDIENEKIVPSDKIILKLFNFYKLEKEKEKELETILAFAKTPDIVLNQLKELEIKLKKVSIELNRMKNIDSEVKFLEHKEYFSIPVYSYARAGLNEIENIPEPLYEINIPLPKNNGNLIGVEIKGNSMEPKFYDGDIVFIKIGVMPENREIGIFIVNNKTLIKIYNKDKNGRIILTSLNMEYEPIVIDEYTEFGIVGKFWKAIIN